MGLEKLVLNQYRRQVGRLLSFRYVKVLAMMILLALVSACSSSTDSNADNSNQPSADIPESPELLPLPAASSISSQPLKARLATAYPDTEIEGWACVSATGLAYVYMFFVEGTVPGVDDTPVGMEVFLDPNNLPTSLDSQTKFIWTEQSIDSILMETPATGSSVSLNNIRFTSDGLMNAYSSTRGQLYCSNDNSGS